MFPIIDLAPKFRMLIVFFVAWLASALIFKPICQIAKSKNIVDNPDARKLQKEPIPVLGGVVVFFGIIAGLTFFKTLHSYVSIFPVVSAMVVMLYIGVIDDVRGIKSYTRFALEIMVALLMVFGTKAYVANFQGMWGIDYVSTTCGVMLSVLTFVGVVNAYNMIDGIDGLSSSLGIQICLCFFLLFFLAHDYSYAALAAVTMAAMLPFFMHNVFGWSSKMFIGDGGTMVLGTMFSAMILEVLSTRFGTALEAITEVTIGGGWTLDFSLIAFTLAVFGLPIADTLRVMFERIARKKSPFSPDNTHLHHLYVQNGYSFIGTTIRENLLNIVGIAAFILLWRLGASKEWQMYGVVLCALAADHIPTALLRYTLKHPDCALAVFVAKRAKRSHIERRGIWLKIQKLIDRA